MTGKMTNEQMNKMFSRWVAAKGSFDLDYSAIPDDLLEGLKKGEKSQRETWAKEQLQIDHTPEIVHQTGDTVKGQRMSRIKTTLGHVYFQTVWMNGALSSSMCFVPEIILETDQERPAYE